MAQAVRCDICGKLFSSSYVKSHKRLAHGSSDSSGVGAVKKILALFTSLSAEDKKKVIEDLSAIARKAK
jgi:DNA-directed RNA polymerase subunit N (RpoN/RPB10)